MHVTLSFPQQSHIARGVDGTLPPNAVFYLAAILRQHGHEVGVEALPREDLFDTAFVEKLVADCDVLGLSANSINWRYARRLALAAREVRPDLTLVLGGIHPSLLPDHVLRTTPADFIVRGEGEYAFPELLSALEAGAGWEKIGGLVYRDRDGDIRSNPSRPLLTPRQLEAQPVPAFDLLPSNQFQGIAVESSRGCAFHCVFCSVPYHRSFRALSAECFSRNVIDSVERAADRVVSPFGKTSVYILDDCFTTHKKRAVEIFDRLAPWKDELRFGIEARADQVTERLAETLAGFELWLIQMGLESGYPEGLQAVDKGLKIEDIERACAILQKHGLSDVTDYAFILGFPWESRDDCLRTLEFAVYLHMQYGGHISLAWYEPYPGSPLWDRRHELGLPMTPEMYDDMELDWRRDPDIFKGLRPRLSWDDFLELEEVMAAITQLDPKYLLFRSSPEEVPAAASPVEAEEPARAASPPEAVRR